VEGHIPKNFFSDFFISSTLNLTKLSLQCCINYGRVITQFTNLLLVLQILLFWSILSFSIYCGLLNMHVHILEEGGI